MEKLFNTHVPELSLSIKDTYQIPLHIEAEVKNLEQEELKQIYQITSNLYS